MKDVTQSSQDWEDFWYNSPINSPYIAMTKQLTDVQKDELIEQYVEIEVDRMELEDLIEFVTETLMKDYSKLSQTELKEYINQFEDDDLYGELVDNVISNPTEVI